jgi:hypothetical protein
MPNKTPKTNEEQQNVLGTFEAVIAAAAETDTNKNPKVTIKGYNGGIMSVGYWGPVVINLAALRLPAAGTMPILFSHDTWSLDSLMGQATSIVNNGKEINISGEIMEVTDTAKQVMEFAKKGFKFQASVGVKPGKVRAIREDETVEANGQTFKGPFRLIEDGDLYEISIVPLGADGSTSAQIAASHQKEGMTIMSTQADNTPQTPEHIRAAAVAEQTRIQAVRNETKDHPEIQAKAIAEGWAVEKVQFEVIKAERDTLKAAAEQAKVQEERPGAPVVGKRAKVTIDKDVLQAAACMAAGMASPDKVFASDTCQKAHDLRIRSLTDLVRASLMAEGKSLDVTRHDTKAFIQAAFSSADIANVISASANKFVREGYGTVEQAWREVSNVRSVVDFKANTGVRLIMSNLLKALAPNGDIQHASISDETRTIQAGTKALMLTISRQDIINDDLGVLSDLPRRLGYASARTLNTDFWAAFKAALAANFSASAPKSNQTTGALTTTSLAAAEALFLALKDSDGNPIGVKASKLLCGTTAFKAARELFISTGMIGGSSKDTAGNVYQGLFKPVFSSYLDAAPWYLLADPMAMPVMETAFLNGNEEPVVETADADFSTLGINMRCYYDYGVAFAEWRGAVRSTGV